MYDMTTQTVEAQRLAGIAELALHLDVRPTTVSTWYQRQERTGFPEPVAILAMGPVWDRDQVTEWWKNWKPLRNMPKVGSLPESREKVDPSELVAAGGEVHVGR